MLFLNPEDSWYIRENWEMHFRIFKIKYSGVLFFLKSNLKNIIGTMIQGFAMTCVQIRSGLSNHLSSPVIDQVEWSVQASAQEVGLLSKIIECLYTLVHRQPHPGLGSCLSVEVFYSPIRLDVLSLENEDEVNIKKSLTQYLV